MTGSTKHSCIFANTGKQHKLELFKEDYRALIRETVDKIWDGAFGFDPESEDLNLPKYLHYKDLSIVSDLSPGIVQMAVNQAGGIVRAVVEKQRRRYWVMKNKGKELDKLVFSKPELKNINPQISARCCEIQLDEGKFRGFVRLFYLGKKYGEILLPINDSSQFRKWANRGAKLSNSVILLNKKLQLSWKCEFDKKIEGLTLGADQGLLTVLSLSNFKSTPDCCADGHSLSSITDKLARRVKGSKGFKQAQTHRKNFINWSINQLNFSDVKHLKLEKVVNIRYKRRCSRKMSHWCNPLIRDKVKRRCEELGVQVTEQSCAYRSQKCSHCHIVRKANRKGKTYSCACGLIIDADTNSSINHEAELPDIDPFRKFIRENKLNVSGFYWKPEGLFTLDLEPIVLDDAKIFQLKD